MDLGTMTATLGVNTIGLATAQTAMKNFEKSANMTFANFKSNMDATAAKMQSFGRSATMYMTVPLALAGRSVFLAAKDFEFSMQKIVGLVGVAQEQVNEWSQDVLDLAPSLGRSPKELADALYFITSSGFKGAEAMDILKKSAMGAASGLGETKSIADLVTSAMAAYSSTGLQAGKVMDILTAAVREGKGEAADFAGHLGDVIPVASQMGVSFDQVAGAVSSVTLTGQNVSKAVTGLRQALFELQKPAVESVSALNQMGVSFDYLRSSLKEKGLLPTLKILDDLTSKYGETVMAKAFPNIRAYTNVLSLLGDRYAANVELQKMTTNSSGDSARAYSDVSETIRQKYNSAMASVQASMIRLGLALQSSIIPLLEGFAKTISNIVGWYNGLNSGTQQFILKMALLLAALGPVVLTMSVLIKTFSGLLSVIGDVIGIFIYIGGFLIANPWIALAAGITAASAALYMWGNNSNKITSIQGTVNSLIGDEVFKLTSVFNKLNDVNTSTTERSKAISIINTRYGEYLANLLTEKSSLNEIEAAQKAATNAMVANIASKTYKAQLEEEMGSISKSFDSEFSGFMKAFANTYGADRISEFITSIYEGADKAIKENSSIQESQKIYDEYINHISAKTGYLKYDIDAFRKSFDNFVKVKYEKGGVVKQIEAIIAAYEKLAPLQKTVPPVPPVPPASPVPTFDLDKQEAIGKVMDKYYDGLTYITVASNVLGSSFKTVSEQVKLTKSSLDELMHVPGISVTDEAVKKLTTNLAGYDLKAEFAANTMDDLNKKIDTNGSLSKVLGESYNVASENLNDYIGALSELGKEGITSGGDVAYLNKMIQETRDEIAGFSMKQLTSELAYTQYMSSLTVDSFDGIENVLNGVRKKLQEYTSTFEKLYEIEQQRQDKNKPVFTSEMTNVANMIKEMNLLDLLSQKYAAYGQQIQQTLLDGADSWDAYGQAVVDVIRRIITASIAEAITAAIVGAIVSTAKLAGKTANPFLLLAIPAFVGLALGAANTAINMIPKMAEGGVIPGGYPNDTYPALLTSGETVVPPGKLNSIQNQNSDLGGEVTFKIDGYELVGVLNKFEKRRKLV